MLADDVSDDLPDADTAVALPDRATAAWHRVQAEDSSTFNVESEVMQAATLLYLASAGDLRGLQQLEKNSHNELNVNCKNYDERTPLHVAAARGHVNVVTYLLRMGADVNAQDAWEGTPLEDAVRNNHREVVKMLSDAGGKLLNRATGELVTLHSYAVQRSHNMTVNPWEFNLQESDLEMVSDPQGIIGSGSFGTVHKGIWRGTPVAVKQLHHRIADEPKALALFRLELNLLSTSSHPNIVQFLGACTTKRPFLMVTEYCCGGNLKELLLEQKMRPANSFGCHPLPVDRAFSIARQIAAGMAYLHNPVPQAIMHRDLKPSNCLFADEERTLVKITDFGLSKQLSVPDLLDAEASKRIFEQQATRQSTYSVDDDAELADEPTDEPAYNTSLNAPLHPQSNKNKGVRNMKTPQPHPQKPSATDGSAKRAGFLHWRSPDASQKSDRSGSGKASGKRSGSNAASGTAESVEQQDGAASGRDTQALLDAAEQDCELTQRRGSSTIANMHTDATGRTGSLVYMAPEVFLQQKYSMKVDVYSYAIILYEMFEGRSPVAENQHPRDFALAAAMGKRPHFINKHIMPDVKTLIRECWAQNPRERPSFYRLCQRLDAMETAWRNSSQARTSVSRRGSHMPLSTVEPAHTNRRCCAMQ